MPSNNPSSDTFDGGQSGRIFADMESNAVDCLNLLDVEVVKQHPPLRRLVLAVLELLQSDVARMEYFEFEVDNFQQLHQRLHQHQQLQLQQMTSSSTVSPKKERTCVVTIDKDAITTNEHSPAHHHNHQHSLTSSTADVAIYSSSTTTLATTATATATSSRNKAPSSLVVSVPPYPVIHRGTWARLERAFVDLDHFTLNASRYYVSDRRLLARLSHCLVAWRELEECKVKLYKAIHESDVAANATVTTHHESSSTGNAKSTSSSSPSSQHTSPEAFALLTSNISKSHMAFVDACFSLMEVLPKIVHKAGDAPVISSSSLLDAITSRMPDSVSPIVHMIGLMFLTPIVTVMAGKYIAANFQTNDVQSSLLKRFALINTVAVGANVILYISQEITHRNNLSRVTNVLTDVQPIVFTVPDEGALNTSGNSTDPLQPSHAQMNNQLTSWQRELAWRFPNLPIPSTQATPPEKAFLYFPRSDTDDGSILGMTLCHQCPSALQQRRLLANVGQAQSSQHFGPFAPISAFFPHYVLKGCLATYFQGGTHHQMASSINTPPTGSDLHLHPKQPHSSSIKRRIVSGLDDTLQSPLLSTNTTTEKRHSQSALLSSEVFTRSQFMRDRSMDEQVAGSRSHTDHHTGKRGTGGGEGGGALSEVSSGQGSNVDVSDRSDGTSHLHEVPTPVPMSSGDIQESSSSQFSPPPTATTTLGTEASKKGKNDGSVVGSWLVGEVSFCLNRLAEASVSTSSRNKLLLSDTTTSTTPLLQSVSVKVLPPTLVDQFQQTDPVVTSPVHSDFAVSGMNTDSTSPLIDSDTAIGVVPFEERHAQEDEEEDANDEEDVDLGVDVTLLLPHNKSITIYGASDVLPNSASTTLSSFELIPYLEIAGSNISVLFVKDGLVLDEVNGSTAGSHKSPVQAKAAQTRAPAAGRLSALIGNDEIARKPSVLFIVAHAPDVIADILKQVSQQQVADVPMESLVVIVTNRVSEVSTLLPVLSALDAPVTSAPHQPSPQQPCRRPFVVVDLACVTEITHVPNPQMVALTTLLGDWHSCATLVFTSSPTTNEVDNNLILSNIIGLQSSSKLDYPLRHSVLRMLVAAGGASPTSRSQSGSHNTPCGNSPQSVVRLMGGSSNIGKPPLAALRHSYNSPSSHPTNQHVRVSSRDGISHDWPRSSHSPLLPPSGRVNRILSADSAYSNGTDRLGALSSGGARSSVTIVEDPQHRNTLLSQSQMTANGILSGNSSVNPSPNFVRGSGGSANGSFRRGGGGSSVASDVFPDGVSCKISRCIGHGTFGVVFLGRLRQMPDTNVAIKQFYLRTGEEDQFLVDIAYEAALLRYLEHPNIVRYYNSFVSDNCVNIVMQYCNGGNLNLRIGSASLRSEEYLMMMRDILEGIVYLHEHSIMHRDLKPENVLFHDGTLMLADFGTATKSIETVDGLHEIKGTFAYMAPEVLLGKEYGIACDIWSFGCICADLIGVPLPHRNMDLQSIRLLYSDASGLQKPVFNYDPHNRLPKNVKAFFDLCFDMDWKKRGSAKLLQECTLMSDPSVITKYQKQLQFGQLAQNSLTSASIAEAKRLTRSMRSNTTRHSGASSLGDVHSAVDGVVLYSVANRAQVVERFLRSGHVSRQNTPINSAVTSDLPLVDIVPPQASPFMGGTPLHRPPHPHHSRGHHLGRSGRSELETSFESGPLTGIRFSRSVNSSSAGGAGFVPAAHLPKPRFSTGRNPNSPSRGSAASNRNDTSGTSVVVSPVEVPGFNVGDDDPLYGSGVRRDDDDDEGGGGDNTDTQSDAFSRSHDVNEDDGSIWFPANQLLGDNLGATPTSPLSPIVLHPTPAPDKR